MSVWVGELDMVAKYMVVKKNAMWHVSVYYTSAYAHAHTHISYYTIQGPFSTVFGSLQLAGVAVAATRNKRSQYAQKFRGIEQQKWLL